MASLASSWARNLGSKCEGKTPCPDHAGAQQPLKQKSRSAASKRKKERWKVFVMWWAELRSTYTWNKHRRMRDFWAALAPCGGCLQRSYRKGGTWYRTSCQEDVALARMFVLALVQLLQLLQAPMEPADFKALFLCFCLAIPTAQEPNLGHRESWVLLDRNTKSSSWFRS